jgi:large subunit ribosomal protein L29
MEIKELKGKTPAQLQEQLVELRREQFNLRMQRGMGQLGKPHELTRVRKDIARVKTVLNATK